MSAFFEGEMFEIKMICVYISPKQPFIRINHIKSTRASGGNKTIGNKGERALLSYYHSIQTFEDVLLVACSLVQVKLQCSTHASSL